jgi:hypothetical protein
MNIRDVVSAAEDQGFRVSKTQRGHWQFLPPDRSIAPIFFSGTPSDQRAILNLLGKLRRAGFIWPWAGRIKKQ